jgi:hypothetical protein
MKKFKLLSTTLVAFACVGMTHIASADGWPVSVVGNWTVRANNAVGVLSITFQGAAGQCRPISGAIFGNPIQGFYCPASGRIHFLRKNAVTNDTFQDYTANLSQDAAIDYMAGTFASDGGSFGEYNFSGSK